MRKLLTILAILILVRLGVFMFVEWKPTWSNDRVQLEEESSPTPARIVQSVEEIREENFAFHLNELKSEKDLDRMSGAFDLGEFKEDRAIDVLIGALDDPHPRVRDNAAWSLGRIGPLALRTSQRLLRVIEEEEDDSARFAACRALGAFGSQAWPTILIGLRNEDDRVSTESSYALVNMSVAELTKLVPELNKLLDDPNQSLRCIAARNLGKIGAAAAESIPAIAREMKRGEDDAFIYAAILREIGPPAISALLEGLADANPKVRCVAVDELGRMEPNAAVWPKLVAATKDPDSTVRCSALVAVRTMTARPADAVPCLLESLNDRDRDVRYCAVVQLGSLGPDGAEGLPGMLKELRQTEPEEQFGLIEAIGNLGPRAKSAVPDLLAAFQDDSGLFDMASAEALANIGPEAEAALPALIEALDASLRPSGADADSDKYFLTLSLVTAVAKFGAPKRELVSPVLLRALEKTGTWNRPIVLEALALLDPAGDDVIAALISNLGDENFEVAEAAAAAIGRCGKRSSLTLPALIEALRGNRFQGRQQSIVDPLVHFGQAASPAVPTLIAGFKDDAVCIWDDESRAAAARALAVIAPTSTEAREALVEELLNPFGQEKVRVAAAGALTAFAATFPEVVQALDEAKAAADGPVRLAATEALRKLEVGETAPAP